MINIKKIIFEYLKKKRQNYENKVFQKILVENDEISLIDIGGYQGIQDRWKKIEKIIDFHIFEPNPIEAKKIVVNSKKLNIHDKALANHDGEVVLNICKEPGVSSVLEPNEKLLKKYPNFERFEIIKKLNVKCKKLDSFKINKIDFIKIDVQGYNLQVLNGSIESLKKCIGIEIECEFKEIYKNQSMFRDVENFLNNSDFELIDFLDIVKWSRNNKMENKFTNYDEIVFVNALFLKKNLEENINSLEDFKKILIILVLFNQFAKVYELLKIFENEYQLNKNVNDGINKLAKSIKRIESINKLFLLISKLFGSDLKTNLLK